MDPKELTEPKKGRPGIVVLARSLGLSVSTVSRALNGYTDVSDATRARIQEAAARLGYSPNVRAQKLRLGRTDSVAFVLSPSQRQYADPFFLPLLTSIDEKLLSLGLDMIVTASQAGEHELDVFHRLADGHRVDGLIFARTRPNDPRIAFCKERGFPFVSLGRSAGAGEFPCVDVDHGQSGHHAASTLLGLGHRSLVLINTSSRYSYSAHCEQGFQRALEEGGAGVAAQVLEGGMTEQSGDEIAATLLARSPCPTAFICGNDAMALGVMHAAALRGLQVGIDISVIGCNDIPVAQFVSPGLSSYSAPMDEVGKSLVDLLVRQIRTMSDDHAPTIYQQVFVGRGSHGAMKERVSK